MVGQFSTPIDKMQVAVNDFPVFTEGFSVKKYLDDLKMRIYQKALDQAGGQTEAARILGVERQTVYKVLDSGNVSSSGARISVDTK